MGCETRTESAAVRHLAHPQRDLALFRELAVTAGRDLRALK
jgi:hypothetical protein